MSWSSDCRPEDKIRISNRGNNLVVPLPDVLTHEPAVLPAHLAECAFDPDNGNIFNPVATCTPISSKQVDLVGASRRTRSRELHL